MGFNIAGFGLSKQYSSAEEFSNGIGLQTKGTSDVIFEKASESYHGSAPDPSIDVFFPGQGTFCITSEEGLDSLAFARASAGQKIIVFRVYEMSMSFYIACYHDGKLVYERVEHEGQPMMEEGDLSIPAGQLETDTIFSKIKEEVGINFWDIEPDAMGKRLVL